MDPTKSFDHLDPKLKETYARVMGTNTNGGNSPAPTPAPADPAFSSPPPAFDPAQIAANPEQNQYASVPSDQTTSQQDVSGGPNPGTGPTVNAVPGDPAMFAPPTDATAPIQDANTQTNASFFSNPSPATADPTQAPGVSDLGAPVEPPPVQQPTDAAYTPADFGASQAAVAEPMTQPLPSPSTVNTGSHEASPLLRVLYIVGAVIFFLVYTFFWIKVFGLPIPFLNV